tara:strand:+ start:13046 stop:13258 length:213 start_codon:yes stop_codon:yes gene_type:complete
MWDGLCKDAGIEPGKSVYPVREVARVLGVSLSTLTRWNEAGRLRSWLLGPRKKVIAREELERYLKEQSDG